MINVANFIPRYPDTISKNFSYEIARRKEFQELKLGPSEQIPDEPGTPLDSQEMMRRFYSQVTAYFSGLVFHGMGTGKTCTSSLIVENFKNMQVAGSKRKPALVLVPNEDLARSYRAQVAYQCTKEGIYQAKFTEAELKQFGGELDPKRMSELKKERRVRSAVAESYEIVTYTQFLFSTKKKGADYVTVPKVTKNPTKYMEEYSDRIIIIDEAHNLRIQPTKKKKRSFTQQLMGTDEPGSSVELYKEMHTFLHLVKNCRILLLTGTPIWDQVYEIASLMNLILPIDQQLPLKTLFIDKYFENNQLKNVDHLKDVLRGKVSFLRPMMTTARRKEMGVTEPYTKYIKVYPSEMSEFQRKYALLAKEDDVSIEMRVRTKDGNYITKTKEMKGGAVGILARDAVTFVFPKLNSKGEIIGGEYGAKGFKNNINVTGKTKLNYAYKSRQIEKAIVENLRMLSSKFAEIIRFIKEHPNEVVYIYDESVASGGGSVINFCLILQALGFQWAKSARDISSPGHKKRFAAITSDKATISESSQIEKFFRSFNKPDNKYGDRCQIIIGSKKIAEGITIKHVRQVHVAMLHWNNPSIEQALGRTFRVGSHSALKPSERYIKIYRHVAVDPRIQSMDLHVASIAESKEHKNTQIYRVLKEIAWDCPLTYKRNVLKGDDPGSMVCDYTDCNYRCDNFPESMISKKGKVWDYTIPTSKILFDTYNLFYSNEELDKLIEQIRQLFKVYFNLHISLIASLVDIDIGKSNEFFLLLNALDFLINSRTRIMNRYGFECYLKEDNDIYFLDEDIKTFGKFSESVYITYPFVTELSPLRDLTEVFQYSQDKDLIEEFVSTLDESLLDKFHYRTLIVILEMAYEIQSKAKDLSKKQKKILQIVMKNIGKNLFTTQEGNVVHNMYATEYTGIGYSVAVQELKPTGFLRIYDKEYEEWRYPKSVEEEEAFLDAIKKKQKTQREDIWKDIPQGVYGLRDKAGKFKIREKPPPGKRATKGSVCIEASWDKPRIFKLLAKLKAVPPFQEDKIKKLKRDKLVNIIKKSEDLKDFAPLDKYSDKQLRSIASLPFIQKRQLCEFLEKWFKDHNLFFEEA